MTYKALIAAGAALGVIVACGQGGADAPNAAEAQTAETAAPETPAALAEVATADYALDKNHAFLQFAVGHSGGLSDYIVHFTDFDVDLSFNATDPTQSTLAVRINPAKLLVNYPGDYKASHENSEYDTWTDDMARNPRWLNADNFPEITFTATDIALTGAEAGTITGDLSFLGQTKPVSLDVTFRGHANLPWYGERDLLGFDAKTTIKRSEFGMDAFIPNIADDVTVSFTGEFLQNEG